MTDGPVTVTKRAISVEAMRWDGTSAGITALQAWMQDIDLIRAAAATVTGRPRDMARLFVIKGDAWATLDPGDWVIREQDGTGYYPCAADVFDQTYDPGGGAPVTLATMQAQVHAWHLQHFGPDVPPWRPFVKTVEELGEVGRALNLLLHNDMADEMGDVMIALMATASRAGIDLSAALDARWQAVQARDHDRVTEAHRGMIGGTLGHARLASPWRSPLPDVPDYSPIMHDPKADTAVRAAQPPFPFKAQLEAAGKWDEASSTQTLPPLPRCTVAVNIHGDKGEPCGAVILPGATICDRGHTVTG